VRLARLLAAGELVLVTIPSLEREQLRDLVRCREDIRADLVRALDFHLRMMCISSFADSGLSRVSCEPIFARPGHRIGLKATVAHFRWLAHPFADLPPIARRPTYNRPSVAALAPMTRACAPAPNV
jgi:hypothetical protein